MKSRKPRLQLNPYNHIFNRLQSIAALLISFGIMCFGHALLNTVVGLRATTEGYSDIAIGLIASAYFVGFIFGTMICAPLISRVGHIRTFGVFVSAASAVTLGLAIYVEPATWIFARLVYGACIAALYMVMESWLNLICRNHERGQILSFYTITNYTAMAIGQALIYLASPDSFTLFAAASIFLSMALIPLSASQTPQPAEIEVEHFSLKKLFVTSRLATVGCFSTGAIMGSFWGIGAVFLSRIGMTNPQVALFIGVMYLGSMVLQWPIGYFSDKVGRRQMIVAMEVLAIGIALFLFFTPFDGTTNVLVKYMIAALFFGGVNNALHSLFIALVNDYLRPSQVVRASGTLLNINATGAIIGPLVATLVISVTSDYGLMLYSALVAVLILGFAIYQIIRGEEAPVEVSDFVAVPRTGFGVSGLYPVEEPEQKDK
ncbi:MAG: MFS transporter [Pseudomonadota bacterium]